MASSAGYGDAYPLFADHRDAASFAPLIDAKTKPVFAESWGDPQGNVTDIERIAEVARRDGVPLIIDNRMPTPHLCCPQQHGADIVLHLLTTYLGGHGTSIGGIETLSLRKQCISENAMRMAEHLRGHAKVA